jgi:hypothetical protein
VHHAALVQALEARPEGVLEQAHKVGVGGARVQEERQLRGQRRGEGELRREGVQLDLLGAVVQPVVVEAKLAKGDELRGGRGARLGDEVG